MAHPEWALKHKKPGTELRDFNGRYYLYKISSKWDKKKKVTRKITGDYLGRITEEDGFIPKGTRTVKPKKAKRVNVKEHGASTYILDIASDI